MDEITTPESPGCSEPVFVIRDVETLKVIADPVRLQVLRLLDAADEPRTVKQIAAEMKIAPTKLYYHVNMLEEHGMIRVASTRVVSGIIEKQYEAAATHFKVDEALITPSLRETGGPFDLLLGVAFDNVKAEIREGIASGLIVTEEDGKPAHRRLLVGNGTLRLTPKRALALHRRIKALLREFGDEVKAGSDGAEEYTFTVAFYPVRHRTHAGREKETAHE